MPDARRTLVKSPPELWAEVSDPASLARHLGEFGEIRITRTEPETIVAWEGDHVRGTVELEPAGWGTKVTLTAEVDEAATPLATERRPEPEPAPAPAAVAAPPAEAEAETEAEPAGAAAPEPEPEPAEPRRGWFSRLLRRRPEPAPVEAAAPAPEPDPEPEPVAAAVAEPAPVAVEEPEPAPAPRDPEALLVDVLDALGSAHHRPFSRG